MAGNSDWEGRSFEENLRCNVAGEVPWLVEREGHYEAYCLLCKKFAKEGHIISDLHRARLRHWWNKPWELEPPPVWPLAVAPQPQLQIQMWQPRVQAEAPAVALVATAPAPPGDAPPPALPPGSSGPPLLHWQDQLEQGLRAVEGEMTNLRGEVMELMTRIQNLEATASGGRSASQTSSDPWQQLDNNNVSEDGRATAGE